MVKEIASKNDANGYYAGRILCDILPLISQLDGLDTAAVSKELHEAKLQNTGDRYQGNSVLFVSLIVTGSGFLLPALAVGYSELAMGSRELDLILNSLLSSISGINKTTGETSASAVEEGLWMLTLLNTMSEVDETFWSRVKEFRIVMLVKTVLSWPNVVEHTSTSWVVSTEILRLLRPLVRWIKDIDGDFWEKAVDLLKHSLKVLSL
jgi:hypothetical protein